MSSYFTSVAGRSISLIRRGMQSSGDCHRTSFIWIRATGFLASTCDKYQVLLGSNKDMNGMEKGVM